VTVSRLALISGLLFIGIVVAGTLLDHFIEPGRGLQSSVERNAVVAGAVVLATWLSLPVKGVTLP
jgi:hypothetical protein